jgi:hypothetical protein
LAIMKSAPAFRTEVPHPSGLLLPPYRLLSLKTVADRQHTQRKRWRTAPDWNSQTKSVELSDG